MGSSAAPLIIIGGLAMGLMAYLTNGLCKPFNICYSGGGAGTDKSDLFVQDVFSQLAKTNPQLAQSWGIGGVRAQINKGYSRAWDTIGGMSRGSSQWNDLVVKLASDLRNTFCKSNPKACKPGSFLAQDDYGDDVDVASNYVSWNNSAANDRVTLA